MMPPYKGYSGYSARRVTFPLLVGSLQLAIIVLFALFARYSSSLLPAKLANDDTVQPVNEYAAFQDVHVMIFAGFGFLMTFLKRYGYSSVGINFVLAAFCIQWAALIRGFLHLEADGLFPVQLNSLLTADFAAATVLISFGAVLGKASPTQLVIMALIEIVCAQLNEYVGLHILHVTDAGESLFVHAFGAYFGLAVARVLYRDDIHKGDAEGPCYHSDIFAMIGTIFLWLFWPSFNGGALLGAEQNRAFANTYLSLASCCVVSFIVSWLCDGRFNMVHIQNSTLAGGVAIGTAADLILRPFGAMIVGAFAGVISVLGYKFITPRLSKTLKIHDTCGVNNLHGMPGILAGFVGALLASSASFDRFGLTLYDKFPARLPDALYSESYNATVKGFGPSSVARLNAQMESLGFGSNRSAPQQAAFQFLAIVITLAIAIGSGTITGFLLRLVVFHNVPRNRVFEDEVFWEVADFSIMPKPETTPLPAEASGNLQQETELKGIVIRTPIVIRETPKSTAQPFAVKSEAPKTAQEAELKEATVPLVTS